MYKTLADVPLLHDLPADLLQRLQAQSRTETLPAGAILFSDHERAEGIWFLLSGEIMIARGEGEQVMALDFVHPGEFLGEISLFTGTPYNHRAVVEVDARLAEIPGDAVWELVARDHNAGQTLLRSMARRIRTSAPGRPSRPPLRFRSRSRASGSSFARAAAAPPR